MSSPGMFRTVPARGPRQSDNDHSTVTGCWVVPIVRASVVATSSKDETRTRGHGCDPRMADSGICTSLITGDPPTSHSPPISDPAMHRPRFPNASQQHRSMPPPGPVPKGSTWHGRPDSTESGREPGRVRRCHEKSAMGESLPGATTALDFHADVRGMPVTACTVLRAMPIARANPRGGAASRRLLPGQRLPGVRDGNVPVPTDDYGLIPASVIRIGEHCSPACGCKHAQVVTGTMLRLPYAELTCVPP